MAFQTFDRMVFGTLTFTGARWYVLKIRDPQMVRDQKKFGNHCRRGFEQLSSPIAWRVIELQTFQILQKKWRTRD